ncbi:hypothetical protein IV102_02975 [bacterium]|nr:hypothetical protein [bacterium]
MLRDWYEEQNHKRRRRTRPFASDKPEFVLSQYGLALGRSGYNDNENATVTGPVLDFLIAHSSGSDAAQEAQAAKRAGKAGDGLQAAEMHRQVFQDIVDRK